MYTASSALLTSTIPPMRPKNNPPLHVRKWRVSERIKTKSSSEYDSIHRPLLYLKPISLY